MRYIVSSRALSLFLVVLACTSFHAVLSAPVHNGKPVIAVIPAAWHSPIHYQLYTTALRSAGYASVSERLPSCDSPDPKSQTVATDAAFIRERLLLPAINRGREIVVIMHSYSGGPGSMAAKGLSVAERRAAGQPGGIVGLIFLSAFVAHDGQTLVSGSGGQLSPWVNQKVSIYSEIYLASYLC